MATRYSGDLKINVTYDDRGYYRASISRGGKNLWRGTVRPAPSGFGPGVAYDSDRAYDEIARAAVGFADHDEGTHGELGGYAEVDPNGYFKIRRVANFHQKWPPGRIKPKQLRDSRRRRRTPSTSTRRARAR